MGKKVVPLKASQVRDRVVRVDRILAGGLVSHPMNWRKHGHEQRAAMRDVVKDIGFVKPVDAYIAREGDAFVAEGKLRVGAIVIMDGHCRVEEMPKDFLVPVNITDLTEDEARYYLATCDPLSGLAAQDDAKLMELLASVDSDSAAVQKMLGDLVDVDGSGGDEDAGGDDAGAGKFQIVITCETEDAQRELLEEFMSRGLAVKALVA